MGQRSADDDPEAGPAVPAFAHEDGAIAAQHVDGGDHHAPEGESGGDLELREGEAVPLA